MGVADAVSYPLVVSVDVVAAFLSLCLVIFLRRQRTRAYLGKSALGSLVLLPIYEPVLWAIAIGYTAQSLLLTVPVYEPGTGSPIWFNRAVYKDSKTAALGPDSGAFWAYCVVSETMSEGFGIMLLHKFPSPEALGSSLRYAFLYAAVAASVSTMGYNWEGLGLPQSMQDAVDIAYLAVPCGLYALLLFQFTAISARKSLVVYALFCVAWRAVLLFAVIAANSSSTITAVVSMVRTICTPFVMYYTLVRDTNYWYAGARLRSSQPLSLHSCFPRPCAGTAWRKQRPRRPRLKLRRRLRERERRRRSPPPPRLSPEGRALPLCGGAAGR